MISIQQINVYNVSSLVVDMKMLKFIKRTILPELRGSEMTTAEFDIGEASIIKKI
jgi:hypothetical protein